MDFGVLANALTIFLAPLLPYLVKAGEKGAEQLGEKLGAGAWEKVKALWGRLKPKMEAKEAAREAVDDVAANPESSGAKNSLEHQLQKLLSADPALAAEVAKLLAEIKGDTTYQAALQGDGAIAQGEGAVAAGKGGIAVGGDVHGGIWKGGGRGE
jgi:hypothetical protein